MSDRCPLGYLLNYTLIFNETHLGMDLNRCFIFFYVMNGDCFRHVQVEIILVLLTISRDVQYKQ